MRALALTLFTALLAVVTDAQQLYRANTGKVGGLRWQPSHALGHHSRRLQQTGPSSFSTANNITSTIVNATRDGGFLVVRQLDRPLCHKQLPDMFHASLRAGLLVQRALGLIQITAHPSHHGSTTSTHAQHSFVTILRLIWTLSGGLRDCKERRAGNLQF